MHEKAKEYIDKLQLKTHPEGGYYKEVYRSDELILSEHLPNRYKSSRSFSTSIYFMLEGKQFSSFHRLQSDEIWHFYDGTSLIVYILDEIGILEKIILGNDTKKGESFQVVVKKYTWFAAELVDKSSYALVGCTVSPGFDFSDFELGERYKLIEKFPQHHEEILKLTR
jgi:predicted cupin superfamily sugar epimerase